jgi:hypothetical protein
MISYMNKDSIDSLSVAKKRMMLAKQCILGDRYSCAASVFMIYSALELILITCLDEKKVISNEETFEFDKLLTLADTHIGSLPNRTRLMGLNWSRNDIKLYGSNVSEAMANEFLNATHEAINFLVFKVYGVDFNEISSAIVEK